MRWTRAIGVACVPVLLLSACGGNGGDARPARTRPGTAGPTPDAGQVQAAPRSCFGAAARVAAAGACDSPRRRLSVVPSLRPGELDPGPPCTRGRAIGLAVGCAFGVQGTGARRQFALLGDSHAARLRSAFSVMARAQRWSGYQLSRDSCAYVRLGRPLPEPYFSRCAQWKEDVRAWLAGRPAVDTVFVAQLTRDAGASPGAQDPFADMVEGYIDAWSRLPASVKHIVVIRDSPEMQEGTRACVDAARRAGRAPGPACAVPRASALAPDPAVAAAEKLRSPRVETIDLSRLFCDDRSCYPVIGGVLVHGDITHLTSRFARTLAPFLLRDVQRLSGSWR